MIACSALGCGFRRCRPVAGLGQWLCTNWVLSSLILSSVHGDFNLGVDLILHSNSKLLPGKYFADKYIWIRWHAMILQLCAVCELRASKTGTLDVQNIHEKGLADFSSCKKTAISLYTTKTGIDDGGGVPPSALHGHYFMSGSFGSLFISVLDSERNDWWDAYKLGEN